MGLALRQWIPEYFIEMQNLFQLNTIKNKHTYQKKKNNVD